MHFASDYTSTKRDLSEHRRMAKSSSTGDVLYSPGRVSPTTDASIDIRTADQDSPIAYKGPTTAVARGAHHEYNPYMQNVTADSTGRMGRLPYV